MRCMHQKAPYACYANTQLRKRLHTMHTETRIGVSVGLRAQKCMQLGMHTKCIQAYKKKKRKDSSFYFFLYCLFFYLLLFASSGIPQQTMSNFFHCLFPQTMEKSGFHLPSDEPSAIIPTISSHAPAGVYAFRLSHRLRCLGGRSKGCMRCMHQKAPYARYANTQLRKRLHTMHTETRIGVSVGLRARKCMQLGMHTDCIQSAYK